MARGRTRSGRASQIGWEDFTGDRPAQPRRTRWSPRRTEAQIATSIRVDRWKVRVEPDGAGGWAAYPERLCVRAYMLKDRSGHLRDRVGPGHLAHEQAHFDITQIWARRLAVRLRALMATGSTPAEARTKLDGRLREAYRTAVSESVDDQDRYERDTDAGNRLPSQFRWQREIAAALRAPESARSIAAR